jgi:hypothetical protein
MRKFGFSLIMIFMGNIIFAQGFDAGVNLGGGMAFCDIKNENDAVTSMAIAGIPIGINMSYFFTNRIGINAYFNYLTLTTVDGGFTAIGYTYRFYETNLKSIKTFESFIGPVFDLLGKNNFSMPLAVGLHLTHISTEIDVPSTVFSRNFDSMGYRGTQFGPGVTFGFRYIFDSGLYLATGIKTYLDFIGKIEANGKTVDGGEMSPTDTSFILGYSVQFGVGYKFRQKSKNGT